jgi:ferredoxin
MAETLRVNPIQCTGHGMCAELLPELITVDEWGYPIVDPRPVPPALDRDARRAVAACPALALRLTAVLPLRSAAGAGWRHVRHRHPAHPRRRLERVASPGRIARPVRIR